MTSKEVLLSTCDRCTKEVTTPLPGKKRRNRGEIILPPGWLHVSGNTATALVFEMDLCDECKVFVLEAAGRGTHSARRAPATSTTRHVESSENRTPAEQGSETGHPTGKKKSGGKTTRPDEAEPSKQDTAELTVQLSPAHRN